MTFDLYRSSQSCDIALNADGVDIPAFAFAVSPKLKSLATKLVKQLLGAWIFAINHCCLVWLAAALQIIGKKPALGAKVIIHIGMVIEMIARQIGEYRNVKFQSAHPLLG